MLERVDNKTVRGPTFVVHFPNVHTAQYLEEGRVATVGMEGSSDSSGRVDWLVYSATLRGWEPPNECLDMPRIQREQILDCVSRSLKLLGMPNRVVAD
jgi:hypothetical protein